MLPEVPRIGMISRVCKRHLIPSSAHRELRLCSRRKIDIILKFTDLNEHISKRPPPPLHFSSLRCLKHFSLQNPNHIMSSCTSRAGKYFLLLKMCLQISHMSIKLNAACWRKKRGGEDIKNSKEHVFKGSVRLLKHSPFMTLSLLFPEKEIFPGTQETRLFTYLQFQKVFLLSSVLCC